MEKKLESSLIFSGKIIKVYKDQVLMDNGIKAEREVVRHQKGISIAIKDDKGMYYMVKQYRYSLGKNMIEFCAGKVEDGESEDNTAIRECEEELGIVPKNVVKLGKIIPSCGYCDEELYLYYGEVDKVTKQNLDYDESLQICKYSLADIEKMINEGIIDDGKTISTLYFLKRMNNA